jgi:beta-glucosidase
LDLSEDNKEAAMKGVNAGVDMDMASGCYLENIATLLAEGKLQQKTIDDAVRNILRLKFRFV